MPIAVEAFERRPVSPAPATRRPLSGRGRNFSSTVKDLVAGSGLEFEDRGATELKGVPGEWRLFAVAGAG